MLPQPLQEFIADYYDRITSPVLNRIRGLMHKITSRRGKPSPDRITPQDHGLYIHANSLSMVFHLPGCEHYFCENCTIEFKDAKVAKQAGFVPCRFCKKLITKQAEQESA